MRVKIILGMAVAFLLAIAISSYAADENMPSGITMEDTAVGHVFANSNGMTLYTFDKDTTPGKSVCNGPCAQLWPPLAASADASPMGEWTVITRDDGSKQWAYDGKPLYTFSKDKAPGETNGQGFNNVWHVAKR